MRVLSAHPQPERCSDSNQPNSQILIYLATSSALFGTLNLGALGFVGPDATDT